MKAAVICASLLFGGHSIRIRTPSITTASPETTAGTTSTVLGDCIRACADEPDSAVYCEAYAYYGLLNIPCTEGRNECEGKCRIADGIEQAKELYPDNADVIGQVSVDTLYSTYCSSDSCFDTDSDLSCVDDPRYWRMDCPDESGSGCSIQFNITVDICQLTSQYSRSDIYSCFETPIVSIVNAENYLDSICGESDLSVLSYSIDYNSDSAQLYGQKMITTDGDCEDLTTICGDDYGEKGYTLTASVSFYCGDCDNLQSLYSQLLTMVDSNEFTPKFTDEMLTVSSSFDSICLDGFGSVDVTDFEMMLKDENGVEIVVFTHDPSGAAGKSLMVAGALLAFMFAL